MKKIQNKRIQNLNNWKILRIKGGTKMDIQNFIAKYD